MLRTYEHTTEFVPVTEPARLPGSYEEALNPGLPRARPLWSGARDKLIMPILPAERKFMLLSMAEVARKLSSNIYLAKLGF